MSVEQKLTVSLLVDTNPSLGKSNFASWVIKT